jgi:hypothetical protein
MIASRANPESARIQISTCGQRARIRPTISWSASTLPAEASMSLRRSSAHSRNSPQKM